MNTFKPNLSPTGLLRNVMLSLLFGLSANTSIAAVSQQPLFLTSSVPPIVMLTMERDHKLYYEAYNDASDVNGDGVLDIHYKPSIKYFGYFDSYKCYSYNSGKFSPTGITVNKQCSNAWSGDYLNYLTTSRMDALRRVLYGGKRSTDSATATVLERSYIPQDAHSWGKEYTSFAVDGYYIYNYTPLAQPSAGTRHVFANTTLLCPVPSNYPADSSCISNSGLPLLRVLNDTAFRVWEWLSIERPVAGAQCATGNNTRTNCAVTVSGNWNIVPDTYFSGLTQTTYNTTGYGTYPTNHSQFDTLVSNYGIIGKKFGSTSASKIDGSGNPNSTAAGSQDNYLTVFEGNLVIPSGQAGSYTFAVDGDDAVEVSIDGSLVVGWYGDHANCNTCQSSHYASKYLSDGNHTITFRQQDKGGGDNYYLYWQKTVPTSSITDYVVRVDACVSGLLENECKGYPTNSPTVYKPNGILQQYGETDVMAFGLLTGSYTKNESGGVLRKNISSLTDEINASTGEFTSTNGIIKTIDALKIIGFGGNYSYNQDCNVPEVGGPLAEGRCRMWGNPTGEMMYEGLRYFAGKAAPTSSYSIASSSNDDSTLGLPLPTWLDPYRSTSGGYLSCAKPSQLVISDINPNFDTDQLPGRHSYTLPSATPAFTGDITGLSVESLADTIWNNEYGSSASLFIGQSDATYDGAPTAKNVTSFGNIRGLSPEEPTQQGGYYASSIALFGEKNDVNAANGNQKPDTLSVALASPLPRIIFPLDGKTVTLVPFAKTVGGCGSVSAAKGSYQPTNTIVDFYVDTIANTDTTNPDSGINDGLAYAKFRINYEDSEYGSDHDMDAIVEYELTAKANKSLDVKLTATYSAGGCIQHMGYVISGTSADQIYLEVRDSALESDVDYYLDTPHSRGGVTLPISTTRNFTIGTNASSAFVAHDPLWYAAKWGVTDKDNDGILDTNEWDDDSDDVPDGYFLVTNAGKLPEQLGKAFAKLLTNVSSASAVAANTTRLDTGTLLYQAKFDPRDWSGQLLALTVNETTGVVNTTTPSWEAAELLPAAASRKIYTYDPSATAGSRGIEFKWDTPSTPIITTVQQTNLNQLGGIADAKGQDRLNWLRGDNANEKRLGGSFRNRIKLFDANGSFITDPTDLKTASIKTNRLGDIVNSDPIYVGTADLGYSDLPGVEGSGYATFRASTTYKNRRPMLYVGANDGMLHGFDARENAGSVTTGGSEIFAYVPNALFPELSKLTSPTYSHQYFVDGAATAGDVYYSSEWHTLVAGVTGAGGKAVFALDVTNPDTFGTASALWEFTSTDTTYGADLGYTLSKPVIARMHNNKWVVIVANGYGSSNGSAVLFVLDAETGAVIQKIDTLATGGNGLSSPVAADLNGDNIVDTIYAGDLKGNLWEFDVSSATASSWSVANSGSPLFVACTTTGTACASANRQPITAKPSIGKVGASQASGVMVYFGTGKYFESTDNIVGTSPQVQSFYGIWDDDTGTITDRAKLQEQTINFEGTPKNSAGTTKTGLIRVSSRKTVCYSLATVALSNDDTPLITCSSTNLKKGWAMNLEIPNTATPATPPTIAQGERVVSTPVMYRDLILFSTLIPSTDPCEGGGKSRVMILEALTGKRPAASTFDLFGTGSTTADGKVNTNDLVDVGGTMFVATGLDLSIDIHGSLSIISNFGFASGSNGNIAKLNLLTGGAGKRASWRQLK